MARNRALVFEDAVSRANTLTRGIGLQGPKLIGLIGSFTSETLTTMTSTSTTSTTLTSTTTTSTTTTTTAAPVFPNPEELDIIVGGIDAGVLSDVYSDNGVYLVLEEDNATPGFDYHFIFRHGTNEEYSVVLKGHYNGNPAHIVLFYQWNFDLSSWDRVTINANDFPSNPAEQTYKYPLLLPLVDYVSGGEFRLRILHTSPGNPIHQFLIDDMLLVLVTTTTTTTTTTTAG